MTITLTREEAQQVLDVIEKNSVGTPRREASDMLRARLAQPEPEPVAWLEISPSGGRNAYAERGEGITADDLAKGWQYIPLYTAPPQREWAGLTSAERKVLWMAAETKMEFAEILEAKLREKNI